MGLLKKIKDILYDDEEFTEQIKITPEMRNEATPNREEATPEEIEEREIANIRPARRPEVRHEAERVTPVPTQKVVHEGRPEVKKEASVSERDLFKTNANYPFLDFDEREFEEQRPVVRQPEPDQRPVHQEIRRQSNVMEYERRKKIERHNEFGRIERPEAQEVPEKKKFKPSPIISPVYGILDKDYSKEDIIQRSDVQKVDVQTVRNKAFGENITPVRREVPKEVEPVKKHPYYEESETVTISEPEEKQKKVKTIDELLEDTADLMVDIDNDIKEISGNEVYKESLDEPEANISNTDTQEMKMPSMDDTLESDLFDLIDSMYDTKEDGE